LELGNLLAQSRYLRVLGLLLAVARERLLGLLSQLTNPLAQHVLVNVQVLGCLGHSHATLGDQPDRLELELAAECPSSLHEPPPVSSSTLTRCHRNRQQPIDRLGEFRRWIDELDDAIGLPRPVYKLFLEQ